MQHSGLSYLLNLLDISPTQMAKYVHVDRSLVSKWKSGSRTIDGNSHYLNDIVEFIYYKNSELNIKTLERLFSSIYPNEVFNMNTENSVKYCIKNFILSSDLSSTLQPTNTTSHSTYTTTVPIYQGKNNKRQGILDFLNHALLEQQPSKLTFVFCGELELLMNNTKFLQSWLKKVVTLLNRGFELELFYSSYNDSKFFIYFSSLIFHKNCTIYKFTEPLDGYHQFSFHILEKRRLFFSLDQSIAPYSYEYGAVYIDPITINVYTSWANRIKESASPLFVVFENNDILENLSETNSSLYPQIGEKYNSSYYYTSCPSYLLMSEELYYDILCHSLSNSNEIKSHFKRFKKLKKSFARTLNESTNIHFYHLDELIKLSTQEYIYYSNKDTLFFPHLRLTQEHFRRHLREIADYWLPKENMNIILLTKPILPNNIHINCWCKRNEFIMFFDNTEAVTYKISREYGFINSFADLFTYYYTSLSPDFKSKETVADILRNIST